MTIDQTGLRVAGMWLAGAALLLAIALGFHGPLHPDLEVQMTRIAGSASRWAAVHWTAAAAFSCFTVASVLALVSGPRLTSTGRLVSAWAVVLVGALWTLTTAVTEATVVKDPQRLVPKWSAAVGAGAGLASFPGWSLGVWFDIGPANLLWVLASGVTRVLRCVPSERRRAL